MRSRPNFKSGAKPPDFEEDHRAPIDPRKALERAAAAALPMTVRMIASLRPDLKPDEFWFRDKLRELLRMHCEVLGRDRVREIIWRARQAA